jgi:hypothetical protein
VDWQYALVDHCASPHDHHVLLTWRMIPSACGASAPHVFFSSSTLCVLGSSSLGVLFDKLTG